MPIKLTEELLAQLGANADESGLVDFTGTGYVNAETKELDVESINGSAVEYSDEAPPMEEMSEEMVEEGKGKDKGAAIMLAFKKASGYEK